MEPGPGKYQSHVMRVREELEADGIILLVIGGKLGHGLGVMLDSRIKNDVPQWLRLIAEQIENQE